MGGQFRAEKRGHIERIFHSVLGSSFSIISDDYYSKYGN